MDYIDIPSYALLRHGTVIVRLRMEVACGCGRPSQLKDYPEAVHRLTKCEQCTRTRTISQFSDCDSGLVDKKSRAYRRSAARSRYVNVCAAACLILLAGSLSPQSTAAPSSPRGMEKDRKENSFWGNPCDTTAEINVPTYNSKMPQDVALYARLTIRRMDNIKNDLAGGNSRIDSNKHVRAYKILSAQSFEAALNEWTGYRWMEEFMSLQKEKGFREKVIHPDKKLGEDIGDMQEMMKDIDSVLPYMYKVAKMQLAGMHILQDHIPVDEAPPGNDRLKSDFRNVTMQLRGFVCEFKELIRSRHLEVKPLLDNEIPERLEAQEGIIFRLFRDTMLYLEYVREVADAMAKYPMPPVPPK